ncbi:zinc finger CCHC domain-containing protein 2-like [Panonychus citri]|uniref:zinc finger CCHC domain-containing protein 2-like n=1 Tax=Panonychus citri TaxID=50023 RepID=UPI0023075821|nr:zinc finger CCHC domain-containing protein 2-like [Panonychus citri]
MVVICKEDVFDWFKKLSGGKRIELMCGLLNLCIPLEWRFFATFLEQAAKRDYNSLKEAEIKANSLEELEKLTQLDWLAADIGPQPDDHHHIGDVINGQPMNGTICNGNSVPVNGGSSLSIHNDSNSMDKHLSSVRSKIVVYLCLLNSTNRVCATLVYKAFRSQLCLENISRHLFGSVMDTTTANGYTNGGGGGGSTPTPTCPLNLNPVSSKPGNLHKESPTTAMHHNLNRSPNELTGYSHLVLDNKFYSEIVLLHTLAIHHPAFTFDQQTLLSEQLQKVQQWMDAVMFAAAATASANSLSSSTTPPNIPVVPPTNSITDLQQSQLVNLTSKLSLKSNLNDHKTNCIPLPSESTLKTIPSAVPPSTIAPLLPPPTLTSTVTTPIIETSTVLKGHSPTPVIATTSCQSCSYTCTCSFSNSNSLATTPSSTPPPTSLSGQHPINHVGSVQSSVSAQPTTMSTSPMHPYWFYFPPPPIPTQAPLINGYTSPAQATEQLFNYYYAVAMAAAASTFGNSAATTTPYWPHFQTANGPITASPFTGMPTPITTGVNSLVAAAATFQTAKSSVVSCYNCGAYGHHGNECKQTNFDEQMIRN